MKLQPDGYTIVGESTPKSKDATEVVRKANMEAFNKMIADRDELEAQGYNVFVYMTQTSLIYRKKIT